MLKVAVEIDRDELLTKYAFAYDHAPKMWLDEKPDDPWFPSTLEYFLNYTMPANTDGRMLATTKETMTGPYEKLPFFHGTAPDADGHGPPVQTLVFPYKPAATDDPLFMLMNPESFTI